MNLIASKHRILRSHKHSEERILPHSPEAIFNLVADVESYPDFLPWCTATRILKTK